MFALILNPQMHEHESGRKQLTGEVACLSSSDEACRKSLRLRRRSGLSHEALPLQCQCGHWIDHSDLRGEPGPLEWGCTHCGGQGVVSATIIAVRWTDLVRASGPESEEY
jgi:hypothetical protein